MAQLVMNQLYPGKQVSELSKTEKQTVSVLGTLAAGLAGGVTGGSAADGMAGAQAGKNSSDNNALGAMGGSDLGFWLGRSPDCDTACKTQLAGDVAKGNAKVSAELAGTVGLGILPRGALVTAVISWGISTRAWRLSDDEYNELVDAAEGQTLDAVLCYSIPESFSPEFGFSDRREIFLWVL